MNEKTAVLIVDDERSIRDGCRRLLTGRGFSVDTAENGRVALEILSKARVDIMLLDLKMPVMGGEELLGIVRDSHPHIPVIIITGHGTVDTAVECMKNGAYDFITKPFEVDQFLLTINRAAEKKRLEQRARLFEEENIKNLYDITLEKSRLRTIINCMANGVMVTNRNLEVVLHNPALMRLMEIPKQTRTPVPINKIIDSKSLIETIRQIQNGETGQSEFIAQEIRVGSNILRAISAPAFGVDRHVFLSVVGAVTVLEDITAFKQLDLMKTNFVNMVAHELRSPLVSIRQLNSVLCEGLAGELGRKQKDFVERGIKKIDVLLELINDLLDVARIEAGNVVQHRVPTDLRSIMENTISLMEQHAAEKQIKIILECSDIRPIQADPKNMEELFTNLLSNAVNYSPGGGEVRVSAKGYAGYMQIMVEDTGIGIPAEELPKIFDQFYRVKHPSTRQVIGTGLGLSIVKGIVEAHHGKIEVESVVNKGTSFKILLPLTAETVNQ